MSDVGDECLEQSALQVSVSTCLSGEGVATLCLPNVATGYDLKQRLSSDLGIPVAAQRLVIGTKPVEDGDGLEPFGISIDIRLVHLPFSNGSGPELLSLAEEGDVLAVTDLLRIPVDPNYQAEDTALTPLFAASGRGHLEIVRLLCEASADQDKPAKYGATPLFAAAFSGHADIVQLFCESCAEKDRTDDNGFTSICAASDQGHSEVVRLLCEAQADMDKTNSKGLTPLCAATLSGHLHVVQLLCNSRAMVDQAAENGVTPFFAAADRGYSELVRFLLQARAEKDRTHRSGISPLSAASFSGHMDVVRLLLDARSDMDKIAVNGVKALGAAEVAGHRQVMLLLRAAERFSSSSKESTCSQGLTLADGKVSIVERLANAACTISDRKPAVAAGYATAAAGIAVKMDDVPGARPEPAMAVGLATCARAAVEAGSETAPSLIRTAANCAIAAAQARSSRRYRVTINAADNTDLWLPSLADRRKLFLSVCGGSWQTEIIHSQT